MDDRDEEVFYDYHIAKLGEEVPYNENCKRVLYIESVFKNMVSHKSTSTLPWFGLPGNPEVLAKIYEKVNLRLPKETVSII